MLSTTALRFLKEMAEAANAPVLRALSGVVLVVIDSAELATQNRSLCRTLCEQIFELVLTVSQELESLDDELPNELLLCIDDLQEKLVHIQLFIQEHLQRKRFGQLAHSRRNAETLASYREDVRHSLEVFQLQAHVLMHKTINDEQIRKIDWATAFPPEIDSAVSRTSQFGSLSSDKGVLPPYNETDEHCRRSSRATRLPNLPTIFYGRSEQLHAVVECIINGASPARIAVLGAGGIGKTAFAASILHDTAVITLFGDRRYFVSCDAADSRESLLSVLAAAFQITSDNPRNMQGQLVQHLSSSKTILVLDNFESPWEHPVGRNGVEALLSVLANISTLTLIITLRGTERPSGVDWTRPFFPPLGPLDSVAARHTFHAIANVSEDDPHVEQLLDLVERMPLGVTLISNLAQYETPTALLSRWAKEQTSMLARGGTVRHSSLDVSIQISIDGPRIRNAPNAVRILYVLSLLPDGLERGTILYLMQSLDQPARCLSALLQTSLAYREAGSRIRVLSPVRAYVLRHLKPFSDPALLAPVYDHFMALAHVASRLGTSATRDAIATCTVDIGNIETVLTYAICDDSVDVRIRAVKAAGQLVKLTKFTGLGNPSPILRQGLEAMRISGDKEALADCMLALAFLGAFGNDHGLLIEELVSTANELYRDIGNVQGQIDCMRRNWAVIVKPDASLMYKALSMAEQLGDVVRQGQCHLELGQRYHNTGELSKARKHFERAKDLLADADEQYQRARCLFSLGNIASAEGHPGVAMEQYRESLALMEDIGSKSGAAHCYSYMGWVSRRLGETPSAVAYSSKAAERYQQTGFNMDLGLVLIQLTQSYVEASMVDEARNTLEHALLVLDKANPKWVYGRAQAAFARGDVAHLEGDLDMAHISYMQAIGLLWERNCTQELAEVYLKTCQLRLSVGDIDAARMDVITSIALSRRRGFFWELAASVDALADVFMADKEESAAFAVTTAILPMLNRLGKIRSIAGCLERFATLSLLIGDIDRARTFCADATELYERSGACIGAERCKKFRGSL